MKHSIFIVFVILFFVDCSRYFSTRPSYYRYAADISVVVDTNYVVTNTKTDLTDLDVIGSHSILLDSLDSYREWEIKENISFNFTKEDFKDPDFIERLNQLEWGIPKYYKKYYFEEPPDSIKPPYVFYGLTARNRKPDNNEKQRDNSTIPPPRNPYTIIMNVIQEIKKTDLQLITTNDVWMLKSKEYKSVNFFEQTFKGITEYYVYFFDYNFENGIVWFDKNYHVVRLEIFWYGTGRKGAIGIIDLKDNNLPLSDYAFTKFE